MEVRAEKVERAKEGRSGTAGERLAQAASRWTGTTLAFTLAVFSVVTWAFLGPLFRYSDTWQLVMNTASSIVTFLMVFLIQRSQNKDAIAIHVKLNEIIAAIEGASNHIVNVEDLSEEELKKLHQRYQDLAVKIAQMDDSRRAVKVNHGGGPTI